MEALVLRYSCGTCVCVHINEHTAAVGFYMSADIVICPLCFTVSSGSQERQDKLREMGFVDILHKLTQSSEPNLSDRWARTVRHKKENILSDTPLACWTHSVSLFRAKTALQQYLA